jgi:DnaJ-class molecular chaperone
MKCETCKGSGETPVTYTDKRRSAPQIAWAWQRCLLCGGTGQREREQSQAMRDGRVRVREHARGQR